MAGRRINLHNKLRDVLSHTIPPMLEAARPLAHLEATLKAHVDMIDYVTDHIDFSTVYGSVFDHHMRHLYRMVFVTQISAFERFLKELAGVCVDHLAPYVLDDRFDDFQISGGVLASHFAAGSVGKAMCESGTW